jgi:hypothetical protein
MDYLTNLLRNELYKGLNAEWETITIPCKSIKVKPTKVHFSNKTTVVIWSDGTKTISKCSEEDTFNKLTGFLVCYYKKMNDISNNELSRLIDLLESEDNIKLN